MVVGIRRSLEEGKTYTYEELSQHLGLGGRTLEHALDHLMELECLRPVVCERSCTQGNSVRLKGCFEHQLGWQA